MSHRAKTPHLGSALSCVDILVAVYWATLRIDPRNPRDRERDRFILSKGHAVSALYAALAYRGFFPVAQLETFNEAGSALAEQPSPACVAGLELATGSLGHGLSVGLGMAFAGRLAGLGPPPPTAGESRWPSWRTPSRVRACPSWRTTTTGTIGARPRRRSGRPGSSSISHEGRVCGRDHGAGDGGRAPRPAFGRHRQPALRALQAAPSRPAPQLRRRRGQHDQHGGRHGPLRAR